MLVLLGIYRTYTRMNRKVLSQREQSGRSDTKKNTRGKGNVDREFWERVFKLVRYVIPDWKCKEAKYSIVLLVLLVIRTMMSIWLADVNGRVVKAIVDKNFKMFIKRVSVLQE